VARAASDVGRVTRTASVISRFKPDPSLWSVSKTKKRAAERVVLNLVANRAALNRFLQCGWFDREEISEAFLKFGAEASELGDGTCFDCVL